MIARVSTWRGWRRNSSSSGELGAGQLERRAAAAHRVGDGVEREVAEAQRRAPAVAGRRAAQQRADAREQLLERERLDEVVVGAGVEAARRGRRPRRAR